MEINKQDKYSKPLSRRAAVGEPVAWTPSGFTDGSFPGASHMLHGRVIFVNDAHRFYVAEAPCNGSVLREAFKF